MTATSLVPTVSADECASWEGDLVEVPPPAIAFDVTGCDDLVVEVGDWLSPLSSNATNIMLKKTGTPVLTAS